MFSSNKWRIFNVLSSHKQSQFETLRSIQTKGKGPLRYLLRGNTVSQESTDPNLITKLVTDDTQLIAKQTERYLELSFLSIFT